jgi:biopolymer transport protein ExbD
MAASQRALDVWIVDLNKVYTGVPFTVVTDWLQQGRLLAADRVRMAGKQKWHPIEGVPALVPYLPKPLALEIEDRAAAEEPIDLGLQSPKVREEEDDDVDMIPLIDVSLVLLIFFMMTTAISSGVFSPIATPEAKHQLASVSADMLWLGIETDKEKHRLFSLGKDSEKQKYLIAPTKDHEEVFAELARLLEADEGKVEIRLRADKTLPIEAIKEVTLAVQELEARLNRGRGAGKAKVQLIVLGEVSEPTK